MFAEVSVGPQCNEALFFVRDRAEAITWQRFPNKSLSCHCLCQGKGRVGRRAAAKPRGSVLQINCIVVVS